MIWLKSCLHRGLLAAWAVLPGTWAARTASAQTPVGDGLNAVYYDGSNFERPMLRRRDAAIDFAWDRGTAPGPGLPDEFFSVRWQGWLLPPTTGRYVLHVSVDDGMRVWLNDKLVLNEWRLQALSEFSAPVQLQAGQPYKLRVEYFQNILDTRALLSWDPPTAKPEPASWRNGWGLASDKPTSAAIPGRYLFSQRPPVAAAPPPIATPKPAPKPAPGPAASGGPRLGNVQPQPAPAPPPRPAPAPRPVPASRPSPPPAATPTAPADSLGSQRVARLSEGQEITLPELLFEQGHAELPPTARPTLDALATALQARPTLRLDVQGHTDNQGNAELNRQLSQRRAETVCLYLTAHGVATERLRPIGYGGTRPVADNADPAQRPRNRRVVLVPQP